MTGQNDREDESLTGQVCDQAGHCPLTGRYFQPCCMRPPPPLHGMRFQYSGHMQLRFHNRCIVFDAP